MPLKRMLAVTHEASLTGAPMNLLHLLHWIRQETPVEVHTLILQDGPLSARFAEVGPVTVLDHTPLQQLLATAHHGLLHLGSRRAWRPFAAAHLTPQLRHLRDFDLVYLNSIASVPVAPYVPDRPITVSHVHELQVALRTRGAADLEQLCNLPDAWIAASSEVRDMLVTDLDLPSERVLLHHEFIEAERDAERVTTQREIERRRRELGLPADAAIVMGAGTLDWRKGPDLFVQLANEVRRRTSEPVSFVWVGGERSGTDWEHLRSDIERSGADHVHFIGVQQDPWPWFAIADVFALTSREDPYPLVCLEHAALGHPIVTYRNGGITELLDEAGAEASAGVVDHLDVAMLAERVMALLRSDSLAQIVGAQLREHVLAHHDVSVAAPRLFADLQRLCAG